MKKPQLMFALSLLVVTLSACSDHLSGYFPGGVQSTGENNGLVGTSVDKQGNEKNVNITMTGGGEIGVRSMDADDKSKMSHALDAGTGKATHWENGVTGIGYTVTPIQKVVVQGNPFCREYSVEASRKGYKRSISGTACVTTDGSWHTI